MTTADGIAQNYSLIERWNSTLTSGLLLRILLWLQCSGELCSIRKAISSKYHPARLLDQDKRGREGSN